MYLSFMQHDTLYPRLTVKEHLLMFARLKGVPSSALNKAADDIIKEVGLTEKVDVYSSNLSGGQKRKLR
jgi:ABC-type multidrug transport system ATPase subunit